jgi:MFS family permease
MGTFTPLFLPELGVAAANVPLWTGIAASVPAAVGLPFLQFWGALADRYSRQPIIARSFATLCWPGWSCCCLAMVGYLFWAVH